METSKTFFRHAAAGHLLVTDEDSADFLQSQFTNDLRPFEAGQVVYGLWLNVKGKVIADSFVLCEGAEQFRIVSDSVDGGTISEHLERHIIADDVELTNEGPATIFEVPVDALDALELSCPEDGQFLEFEGGVVFLSVCGSMAKLLVLDESVIEKLEMRLSQVGFTEQAEEVRGLLRVRTGIPLVPQEIGPEDLPGEGGFERAGISFTKGCYLGQEVVARMHNVGKAQRQLFRVTGEGLPPTCPSELLNEEGKKVGELRSAYPDGAHWEGAALLKTRFVGVGSELRGASFELSVRNLFREGAPDGVGE